MKLLFSQRNGLKTVKDIVQKDNMDNELRTSLWNALDIHYWSNFRKHRDLDYFSDNAELAHSLWFFYFKYPLDELPDGTRDFLQLIKKHYFSLDWHEVFSFIEQILELKKDISYSFIELCNFILEREVSAYRIVDDCFVQITTEQEIEAVENAIGNAPSATQNHLKQALQLFADRQNPDYRNSVKESISAVEAICSQLARKPKASLGEALKELEKQKSVELHPALRESYSKLYGYTSDANGIRHAMLDEPNISSEDAKFMLVSCSAFINYLIEKAAKAGIKLS